MAGRKKAPRSRGGLATTGEARAELNVILALTDVTRCTIGALSAAATRPTAVHTGGATTVGARLIAISDVIATEVSAGATLRGVVVVWERAAIVS